MLVNVEDSREMKVHVPLLRRPGGLKIGSMRETFLADAPWRHVCAAPSTLTWGGLRLQVPANAVLHWPVYDKEGAQSHDFLQARLVIDLPISAKQRTQRLTMDAVPPVPPTAICHEATTLQAHSSSGTPFESNAALQALILQFKETGESVTCMLPVETEGDYELYGNFLLGRDYGTVTVYHESTPCGPSIPCFAPRPGTTGPLFLETLHLKPGKAILRISLTAKNSRGRNSLAAIRHFYLNPLTTERK
jgi:hypothetical protein